jgi:glycosyltransferase involved in cell wall biosynthesis
MCQDHYDFVWVGRAETFEVLGRPRLGPTVVDIDDLEDWKILSRLRAMGFGRNDGVASMHDRGAVMQARLNARRWRRFQRSVAAQVARASVCSELDLERFGMPNGIVVPNGYETPDVPAGRDEVGARPTLLLVGNFCYPPNSDAARWLVTEVLPILRQDVPAVEVRLVGEPDTSVSRLASGRSVTVVGQVAEMDSELVRADVIAVPVRFGSGTRIKILEAFANRIPVVSTTTGAEGLSVENGRELLLADDAPSFARSCALLMRHTPTRRALADAVEWGCDA